MIGTGLPSPEPDDLPPVMKLVTTSYLKMLILIASICTGEKRGKMAANELEDLTS